MAGGLRAPSADELETVAGQLNLTGTVAMAYPPPDREHDLRVAEVDGRVAGSAVVQVVGSETVFSGDGTEAFCRGHVVAEHRRRGIGAALLHWTLGRAAAEPGVREAWTQVRDPDGVALLEAAGFRHDRTGQVMRNTDPGAVPEPDWPEDIRVDSSLRGKRLVEAGWSRATGRSPTCRATGARLGRTSPGCSPTRTRTRRCVSWPSATARWSASTSACWNGRRGPGNPKGVPR
jgi:GNAT superfamily N-acetyltransferase